MVLWRGRPALRDDEQTRTTWSDRWDDRAISIRTSRVENFAELAISDRGLGIPEDKLKEVFEPFVTRKLKGMGVG